MAFVTPSITSSFVVGATPSASICKASTSTSLKASTACNQQSMIPRMAFSSIDDPSSEIVGCDNSVETGDLVISNLYNQIFGNAYIMESEREELRKFESEYRLNKINVRELAMAMGKSSLYQQRYFERSGPYRFIELNFKHFLGRGPSSQEEISHHVQLLTSEGYEAEIESYFNSKEYLDHFGIDTVPRFIFKGTYEKNDDFNRMCLLRNYWDGCSTSTITGSTYNYTANKAKLVMPKDAHVGNPVAIKRGIRADHYYDLPRLDTGYEVPLNSNASVKIRIKVADNSFKVFETEPFKPKDVTPSWIKEMQAADSKKKWNGVWF